MKEPKFSGLEAGSNYALSGYNTEGKASPDYSVNFNASVVSRPMLGQERLFMVLAGKEKFMMLTMMVFQELARLRI